MRKGRLLGICLTLLLLTSGICYAYNGLEEFNYLITLANAHYDMPITPYDAEIKALIDRYWYIRNYSPFIGIKSNAKYGTMEVVEIISGTPAAQIGLQPYDVIATIIRVEDDLAVVPERFTEELKPGDRVKLIIYHRNPTKALLKANYTVVVKYMTLSAKTS